MLTLAEKLSLESSLTDSLKKLNEASGKKIRLLSEKCSGGDFSCLKKQSDLMRLAVNYTEGVNFVTVGDTIIPDYS